jgi:uncharacterized coiled-coil protein SlyX
VPPAAPPTTTPDPFQTPKVEPKPLEAPASSNFMSDLAKAFQKSTAETPPPEPPKQTPPPPVQEPPKAPELPDEEPPAHFTAKAKEDWRKKNAAFKAEIKTREDRIRDLEGQLAKAQKGLPELEADLTKTRQTLEERNQALERFDVERSPIFKEKVLEPEETVRSRLAKNDLQPTEIAALLSGNITQREQILENPRISAYRKGQIIQLLDKWDEVQETKGQMIANGRKSLEDYGRQQAEAEQAKKAQFLREAQEVFQNQEIELMNKLEPFAELPGDPNNKEWNQAVATRKQLAKAIYSGALDRQGLAQAAMWAAAGPTYRQLLQMALGRIQELSTTIDKMRGVQPGVRDSGGDTQILQPPRPARDGDFVKDLVDRFNKEAMP